MRRIRWTSRTWRAPKGDGKRSRESAWAVGRWGTVSRHAQGEPWHGFVHVGERGQDSLESPLLMRRVDAKRWVECQLAKGAT